MKRTLMNLMTFIFLSFLAIGIICILQNVVGDLQKTFCYTNLSSQQRLLAYQV